MARIKYPTLRQRLLLALEEDKAFSDVTSDRTVPKNVRAEAILVAKQRGILAGISIFKTVFSLVDKGIEVRTRAADGDTVHPGQTVAELRGPMHSILRAERLALNHLCHLSGVATLTAECVKATRGTKAAILDTRKTTPLWRDLEREAVVIGGGVNHRYDLADMVLVKDNHIDVNGGITPTLTRLFANAKPRRKVIVETRTLKQVREALAFPVNVIMLDNMGLERIAKAMKIIDGRAAVEVSGGLGPKDIRALARMGVDRISIGRLTHSAPAVDFSLRIETDTRQR